MKSFLIFIAALHWIFCYEVDAGILRDGGEAKTKLKVKQVLDERTEITPEDTPIFESRADDRRLQKKRHTRAITDKYRDNEKNISSYEVGRILIGQTLSNCPFQGNGRILEKGELLNDPILREGGEINGPIIIDREMLIGQILGDGILTGPILGYGGILGGGGILTGKILEDAKRKENTRKKFLNKETETTLYTCLCNNRTINSNGENHVSMATTDESCDDETNSNGFGNKGKPIHPALGGTRIIGLGELITGSILREKGELTIPVIVDRGQLIGPILGDQILTGRILGHGGILGEGGILIGPVLK